jgi:hypothetical protein
MNLEQTEYKYKVLGFSDDGGSVFVKFFTNDFPEGTTNAIDIIEKQPGVLPSEEELKQTIASFFPKWWMDRVARLRKQGFDVSCYQHLVGKEFTI